MSDNLDDILNSALDELDNDDKQQKQAQKPTTANLPTQILHTPSNTTSTQNSTNNIQYNNSTEQQSIAEFQEFLNELQKSGLGNDLLSSFGDESKMQEMMHAMSNLTTNNTTPQSTQTNNPNTTGTSTATAPSSTSTSTSTSAPTTAYNSNIEQAIKMIAEGNKDTTSSNMPDFGNSAEMDELFSKLMADMGGSDNEAGMDTMIEKLMQSMLSKDVLYAPMKDIESKYPAWLQANKPPKLSDTEYKNYTEQYRILQQICRSFETEPNDMNTIMTLMTEMQQYGQPPNELVPLDANGQNPFAMPSLPGGATVGDDPTFDDPEMAKMLEQGCKQQ